jgi:hypothetical protein
MEWATLYVHLGMVSTGVSEYTTLQWPANYPILFWFTNTRVGLKTARERESERGGAAFKQ